MATETKTESKIDLLPLSQSLAPMLDVGVSDLIPLVKSTCFAGGGASDPQLFMFLSLAKQLELNPFNREIYAFVANGKMQTIVGFDGWVKIATRHPQFAGFEFFDHANDNGALTAITCRMWRKDWKHSAEATEYLAECKANTEPWNKWPHRMLRNKAFIQCARMTFGFAGVVDPDEAERIAAPTNWKDQPSIEVSANEAGNPHQADNDAPVSLAAENSSATDDPAETPATTATQTAPTDTAGASPQPSEANSAATVASGYFCKDCNETHTEGCPLIAKQATAEPESEGKHLSPKKAREKLDKLISRHVPAARLNLMLGRIGKPSVDELDDAEVQKLITQIERKAK